MKFETKREAAEAWIKQDWNTIQSYYLNKDMFSCYKAIDEEEDESLAEAGAYVEIGEPMWSYWFQPKDSVDLWKLQEMQSEIAGLGFVLIIDNDDQSVWGLGIDGAGFDFYEHYWIPLYDLFEFKWHAHHGEDDER